MFVYKNHSNVFPYITVIIRYTYAYKGCTAQSDGELLPRFHWFYFGELYGEFTVRLEDTITHSIKISFLPLVEKCSRNMSMFFSFLSQLYCFYRCFIQVNKGFY